MMTDKLWLFKHFLKNKRNEPVTIKEDNWQHLLSMTKFELLSETQNSGKLNPPRSKLPNKDFSDTIYLIRENVIKNT